MIDERLVEKIVSLLSPPNPFFEAVGNIAREHGLPPELIDSIIQAESKGDPKAVSPTGAMGLMQLMPETARQMRVSDPFNPLANIRGGARYLKNLLLEFSGNLSLALAAYNAGPGSVRKYHGIPPYPQTREFVRKVTTDYQGKKGRPLYESHAGLRNFPPWESILEKYYFQGSPRDLAVFLKRFTPESAEVAEPE